MNSPRASPSQAEVVIKAGGYCLKCTKLVCKKCNATHRLKDLETLNPEPQPRNPEPATIDPQNGPYTPHIPDEHNA